MVELSPTKAARHKEHFQESHMSRLLRNRPMDRRTPEAESMIGDVYIAVFSNLPLVPRS
jgi:hypothetical protein